MPKRNEIPVEKTWNLEAIFATDQDWEDEFKRLRSLLPELLNYKGKLTESAKTLYDGLEKQNEITERLGRLYTYAHMRYDQDTTNSLYQGLEDRAASLASQVGQTASFIIPELLSVSEETIQRFMEEFDALKLYRQMFAELNQQRAHVLSEKEESILAQASEVTNTPGNAFSMLNNADLKFPVITDENGEEIEVTHGRYISLLESADRRVRKEAFHAVYSTYDKFKNTFASTLNGQVKRNLFYANTRNYKSARHSALSKNHIPEAVYEQLVETVNKNLHLLHRYVNVRKRLLGVDELHMYDLYTPLIEDVKMEIPYEEAKELVIQGAAPLGEDYVETLRNGFDSRWSILKKMRGSEVGHTLPVRMERCLIF